MNSEFIEPLLAGVSRQLQSNNVEEKEEYTTSPGMGILFCAFGALIMFFVWSLSHEYRNGLAQEEAMAEERQRQELEQKIKEAAMKRKAFLKLFHDCDICKKLKPEDFRLPSKQNDSDPQEHPELESVAVDIETGIVSNGPEEVHTPEGDQAKMQQKPAEQQQEQGTDDGLISSTKEMAETSTQSVDQIESLQESTQDSQQAVENSDQQTDEEALHGGSETNENQTSDGKNSQSGMTSDENFAFLKEVGTVRTTQEKGGEVPNMCVICLEPYSNNETIVWSNNVKCSHAFHQECIVEYLLHLKEASEDKPPCPCCRQVFLIKPKKKPGWTPPTKIMSTTPSAA